QLELGVLAELPVERRERLIEQQELRPLDQRPRERHALTLPARELVRLAGAEASHLHDVENVANLTADLGALAALLLEPEGAVPLDTHVREQCVTLEHHVHRDRKSVV